MAQIQVSWSRASELEYDLMFFLGVGVLLCRGSRLLTGGNTRCLRLWEVETVRSLKPEEKGRDVGDRSVTHF